MKQLLLAQEHKDGKIHPEREPDIIDWLFCVAGFLIIEALPATGIITSWIAWNFPGFVISLIFAVGLPYILMREV